MRARTRANQLATQVVLVAALLVTYVVCRRLTEGSPHEAGRHADAILRLEGRLGIDVERGWNAGLAGHDRLAAMAAWTYRLANWGWVARALALLWWRDRLRYTILRDALIAAAAVGVACYRWFPVAPPRLLAGYTDLVYGTSVGVRGVPTGGSNVFAAFPSYHVGWPIAAGLALAASWDSRAARIAALVPGTVLAYVVIATANHYVIDVVGGVAISVTCLAAATMWHQRQPGRTASTDRPFGSGAMVVADATVSGDRVRTRRARHAVRRREEATWPRHRLPHRRSGLPAPRNRG